MELRPEAILLSAVTWQVAAPLPVDRRVSLAAAAWLASDQGLLVGALPALLAYQEASASAAAPRREMVILRDKKGGTAASGEPKEETASTP
jgi:hypothetical protein